MLRKIVFSLLCSFAPALFAADGKLLATAGLLSIEGSAGGGITPWAVIAGYGEADQFGGGVAFSQTNVDDFSLSSASAAFGWRNRLELSAARQHLDLPAALAGNRLSQEIVGLKLRLGGDLIFDQWPQLSLGAQFKRNTSRAQLNALGIADPQDVDYILSASRLFLDGPFSRSVLLNLGARSTKAQQTGLLGFSAQRETVFEASAAMLLSRTMALGVEFRQKPDELLGLREQHWRDIFIAWFPNKHLSVALAYVELGRIAGSAPQNGYFFTLQGAF